MKKSLVALVAVLMLLSILLPCTAVAATDASSRITVYSQYKKSSGKYYYSYENGFGLRDGTIVSSSSVSGLSGQKDCLAQGGCCLFSYAHAIQWVQGYKASDQLLKDLLKYCVAPSNNHGHNYSVCKNHASSFVAFNQYARDNGMTVYRLDSDSYSEGGISKSAAEMCTLLCDGYALIIHIPGHYICAVDYVICDANGNVIQDDGTIPSNCSAYFQIVDSSSSSSTKSGRTFYGKTYKLVTNSDGSQTLVKRDAYSFGTGNSYWVKVSSLSVSAVIKGSWSGHQVADKIGGYSLAGEIQVVVTTRTDKGISEYKLQDEPYAAANTVCKVAPGTDLTVTGVYKNKYGNYWLRFSDGTFLCANDVVLKTQVSAPTASGLVYPKGNLPYGDGFNLRGTITSKSTMLEVWAAVYKLGDNSFTPVTAYLTNVKTVDIVNSALNVGSKGGIRFGNLAVGNYHFTLWGKYYTYADAEKTSDNPLRQTQFVLLVDEPFSVVKDTPISQITISNVPSEPLLVDEYWYLDATVAPATATNKTLKWSSSNPTVISVDQEGRLEGLAEGSATITVTATDGSGVKASVTISCIEIVTAESLTVNTNYVALEVGESERITATITPANAAYGPEWWSANESIATVSQDGVITAVGPGSTEIRVEVESWHAEPGFLFETIWVDVTATCQHPNKTTIEGADYNLHDYQYVDKDGHTYQFLYDWYEWCPDCQEMIGGITTGGGSAYEAHTYTEGVCTLCGAVETPFIPVERIVINNPVTELYVAAPYSLRCTVYPSNATNQEVVWSSNHESILWITAGEHAAMVEKTGTVVVTVTAADGSGVSASMEIQVLPFASDIAIQPVSEMNVGESTVLSAQVTPVNAYNRVISWSSSNEAVATVNAETGVVTAKAAGTVAITASVEDVWALSGTVSGVSATVTIKVSEAPEPSMPGLEEISMTAGRSLTAVPGGTVTVPVSLNNPNADLDIGAILLRYTLPTGVTISNVEVCGIAAGADKQHSGSTLLSSLAGIKGSGKFLNITFQVAESAAFPLTVKVSPEVTILSTEAEITLPAFSILIEEGSVRVPGDVNDDGKVSMADFLRLSKYLAEWPDIVINASNADVNGDGKVSMADFLRLSKYLAEWPGIKLE